MQCKKKWQSRLMFCSCIFVIIFNIFFLFIFRQNSENMYMNYAWWMQQHETLSSINITSFQSNLINIYIFTYIYLYLYKYIIYICIYIFYIYTYINVYIYKFIYKKKNQSNAHINDNNKKETYRQFKAKLNLSPLPHAHLVKHQT